jgi:hypothetical protein
MFKKKLLFVVGAGASREFGPPVGKTLASTIKNKMDIRFDRMNSNIGHGDLDLFMNLTGQMRKDVNELQQAAWLIRDGIGLAQSIDDFLDLHRTNSYVNLYGKAAIVKCILEAERASILYFGGPATDDYFNPDKCAETWIVKFLHMLGRGVPREDLPGIFNQVSFIVFNYDRCIEHFLRHALKHLYAIDDEEAQSMVAGLRVIHPYGAPVSAQFGATRANYAALATGIQTYTEQTHSAVILEELQTRIGEAEAIVFLGFAYHDQNMRLIAPLGGMSTKPIFGTALGMSDPDVELTTKELCSWYLDPFTKTGLDRNVQLNNKLKCADLFDHFNRSLTAGN